MTPSRAANSEVKPATDSPGRLMQRLYRDVGLSAVARELELSMPDLDTEVGEAVKRGARYVYLAPKADRESQALTRQPASAVSPDPGTPDACAAAVPASLPEPASVKRAARHVNLAPKAGRNDISGPSQALPRPPASAISPGRGSPDASAAAVAGHSNLAPEAERQSGRNDTFSPSQALPRPPASAISPGRGSPDASAAAVASQLNLAPKPGRESGRNDTFSPSPAFPRPPASAISAARGSPDASAAAVLASLLGLEAVKPRYVHLAPKADREFTLNDTSSPSPALPRPPASAVSPARGSSDASAAAVASHLNLAPKADRESRRNNISSPSQPLLRQPASANSPAWGLLLRRQPASTIPPARGSSDASAAAVARHVNLTPKADRESRRNDTSSPSQPLLRQRASANSAAWGLLLRRQPASTISPARGLSEKRAAAVAAPLLGPSLAGGRAGSSSTKFIRGEVGPMLRTGGEEGAGAHKQRVKVTPDRFKRLDKSFWPVLPKNCE
jgi:hypothetical protein